MSIFTTVSLYSVGKVRNMGLEPAYLNALDNAYLSLDWNKSREVLGQIGIFVNEWSLEPSLVEEGYIGDLYAILDELDLGPIVKRKIQEMIDKGLATPEDIHYFCNKIEEAGKGRVAQRLGAILHELKIGQRPIPCYILDCFKYLMGDPDPVEEDKMGTN